MSFIGFFVVCFISSVHYLGFYCVSLVFSHTSIHHLTGPLPEEQGHGKVSLKTYYHYFRAGSGLGLLAIIIVFVLGEVMNGKLFSTVSLIAGVEDTLWLLQYLYFCRSLLLYSTGG